MDELFCTNEEKRILKSKRLSKLMRNEDMKKYIMFATFLSMFLILGLYGKECGPFPAQNDYIECPKCGFWSWTCEYCGQSNPSLVNTCQKCGRPKEW